VFKKAQSRPSVGACQNRGCMMWINPNTNKGWTDEEECALAEIMGARSLDRLSAIRLYRRFKGDLRKALKYACTSGNPELQANRQVALVKARRARRLKGVFYRENRSQRRQSIRLGPLDDTDAKNACKRAAARKSNGVSRA